jgi:hypothetical protein
MNRSNPASCWTGFCKICADIAELPRQERGSMTAGSYYRRDFLARGVKPVASDRFDTPALSAVSAFATAGDRKVNGLERKP